MIRPSVLSLVKDRPDHFGQMIEGLGRASLAPLEVIVIDMSDEPIEAPLAPFPIHIRRLEGEGLALAKARNLAAEHAKSNHLLFLDVDCIPTRSIAARLSAVLSERDALVCLEALYLAEDEARGAWREDDLLACGRPHPIRPFPKQGLRAEDNAGLFWSLAFGIRRETFRRLGGFDERFRGYGAEDTDFGYRAAAARIPLLFLAGPGVFHQHHEGFDPPVQHFDDVIRNAETFQKIWGTWPMEGWLNSFEAMGLIRVREGAIERLRPPSDEQMRKARKPRSARF
jgi:hypothetical protein